MSRFMMLITPNLNMTCRSWRIKFITGFLLSCAGVALAFSNSYYNVKLSGAAGSGQVDETKNIQQAIDSISADGGGTIYFPPGKYLIKTIRIKDNITLELDRGATLFGGPDITTDNPYLKDLQTTEGRPFKLGHIIAIGAKNIAIKGDGVIDGQGFPNYYPAEQGVHRPSLIRLIDCQNVLIEDITLLNSASWVQHYIACDDLTIRGITVKSYANKNNDGIDIDDCHRVIITQCKVDSEDDSIVLKSFTPRGCKDIVISDCIISGLKSAIKTGTESLGNFENISITNCTVYGTRGISLLSVDGGSVNNITISNISMRDTYAVLVMRLGNRMRPYAVSESELPSSPGSFKNIIVTNIQAIDVTESNDFISGIPGHYIENISLSNIRISYKGGGNPGDSGRSIPEESDAYPKAKMFGTLPSYGLFIRHARHISLHNIWLSTVSQDGRSILYCDDVENLQIEGLEATSYLNAAPFFWFKDVSNARVINVNPRNPVKTFLKIEGTGSSNILLSANDVAEGADKIDVSAELKPLRVWKKVR